MAETTDKAEGAGIATPDALAQVEALKTRVLQSGAEVEEANRRSASATEAARVAIETANAAVEAVGATNRTSELDAANRDMEDLKAKHREAFTAADADALADVQAKMARLGGRIERLETEKAAKPARTADAGRATPRDPGTTDQFEQFLSTRTPQTAAWLRRTASIGRTPWRTARSSSPTGCGIAPASPRICRNISATSRRSPAWQARQRNRRAMTPAQPAPTAPIRAPEPHRGHGVRPDAGWRQCRVAIRRRGCRRSGVAAAPARGTANPRRCPASLRPRRQQHQTDHARDAAVGEDDVSADQGQS